ncbi:MAG TPA: hypothetical protein VMV63_09375 [Acidithiobacillus sp.]|nr:hypothetical protein [Acidithiobacillus sp.]
MASITTRKEPVLEEQRDADDDGPLLLTHLLRQGLPPQLWRHTDDAAPEAEIPPSETGVEAMREDTSALPPETVASADPAARFSMQWEEAAATATYEAAVSPTGYAQANPHWLEPDAMTPESLQVPETVKEHALASDPVAPAVPTFPVDLDFLKDFEELLFQEIERRIINEIEDLVTQHLQTVWKEQVSLTIMRTLALEGIKLRESLAGDIRKSLPEILQRVLHEGLDQINASEIE